MLTFNTLWIGSGADQRLCAYIHYSLDWKRCRKNVFVLTLNPFPIGSGASQRLGAYIQLFGLEMVQANVLGWACVKHSTLFGLEGAQTNIFVLTFNTLWFGSGADQRLRSYIQHSLDCKRCRPTSSCLHSTLFRLDLVQTNVSALLFNTLWIESGADHRLCAYIQCSSVQTNVFVLTFNHSTLFGLEGGQTNVFVLSFNTVWIGSGADQRLCVYIQPLLKRKRRRPMSLCSHSTLFGLEGVQTTIFVLTFNTLWIGSGADQRLCAYIQPFLDWKR